MSSNKVLIDHHLFGCQVIILPLGSSADDHKVWRIGKRMPSRKILILATTPQGFEKKVVLQNRVHLKCRDVPTEKTSNIVQNVRVYEAWSLLFESNEWLHQKGYPPRSDEELYLAMKAIFNKERSSWRMVANWRARYNRGVLTGGVRPQIKSTRYGPVFK